MTNAYRIKVLHPNALQIGNLSVSATYEIDWTANSVPCLASAAAK